MKKNIFYSFIVAILLSSCQGMDLMPADKMSDGDYWLTENDFKIYDSSAAKAAFIIIAHSRRFFSRSQEIL